MKQARIALLLLGLPALAHAQGQGMQVPGIEKAGTPSTSASQASASASTPPAPVPAGWPPAVNVLGPSAPLTLKEQRAAWLARRWKERRQMPVAGQDGTVHYLYGSTMPTLVCAPLHVCTIELQPGEIILPPANVGDPVRWQVWPTIVGSGLNSTTVLVVKPTDSGLVSNLVVTTSKRVYTVTLKSTLNQWMPRMAFDYPDDVEGAWASYSVNAASAGAVPATAPARSIDSNFRISGDNPIWRPLRVSTDGTKTFIEFRPDAMRSEVPVLVGLVDNGWFSPDAEQKVNYRPIGNQYVVDQVITKAALIYGTGTAKTQVTIRRGTSR